MWRLKKKIVQYASMTRGGFIVGQIVRHRVTDAKAVIVRFGIVHEDDTTDVTLSVGWSRSDEFDSTIAEIEPWRPSAPVEEIKA